LIHDPALFAGIQYRPELLRTEEPLRLRFAVNNVSGLLCNASAKYAHGRCPDRAPQGISPIFRASLVQTSAVLRPFHFILLPFQGWEFK